jgi:hypothetical protein
LVRQVLENLASFLGVGQFGYVLEEIGFEKEEKIPELINILILLIPNCQRCVCLAIAKLRIIRT